MDLDVVSIQGKVVGSIKLDDTVWDDRVNLRLISQALAMYRNNQRLTIGSTKTRGEVSGGGAKPWKQKHTGRARAGSNRSPLWRHGGITFGPKPRNVHYRLPQTIRRKALIESMKGKLRDKEVVVLDELKASEPKTKPFAGLAKTFELKGRGIIVLRGRDDVLLKSLRKKCG